MKWESSCSAAKEIMGKIKENLSSRRSALKQSQFQPRDIVSLRRLRTDEIRQIISAPLAIHNYALNDARIGRLFFHMLDYQDYLPSSLDGAQFLQLILSSNSRRKTSISYNMSVLTVFEAHLYFLSSALLRRKVDLNNPGVPQNVVNSTLGGIAVQFVQKSWNELKKSFFMDPAH